MKIKNIFIFVSIINCFYAGNVLCCKTPSRLPVTSEQSVKVREVGCRYGDVEDVLQKLYGDLGGQENSGISKKDYEKYGDVFVLFVLIGDGLMEHEKENLIIYIIEKGNLNLLKKYDNTPIVVTFLLFSDKKIGQYILNTYFYDKNRKQELCDSISALNSDTISANYPLLCKQNDKQEK